MNSETEVVVTPSGYQALGKENLTPGELQALLVENNVKEVKLRVDGKPDYEMIGKAIYGFARIGIKLNGADFTG